MGKYYVLWNKVSDVLTPDGKRFTADEWMDLFQWIKEDGAVPVVSSGLINGSFIGNLPDMVLLFDHAGKDFSDAKTNDDLIDLIELYESEMTTYLLRYDNVNHVETLLGLIKQDDVTKLPVTKENDFSDVFWMDAQLAFDQVTHRLLGSKYYSRFNWIQNGRANVFALTDIMNSYPRWLCRIITTVSNFFRS